MSKLTDLLKDGDVKYLQRDSWENNKYFTVVLEFNVEQGTVTEHVWENGRESPLIRQVNLTLDEALADDWEIVELDV